MSSELRANSDHLLLTADCSSRYRFPCLFRLRALVSPNVDRRNRIDVLLLRRYILVTISRSLDQFRIQLYRIRLPLFAAVDVITGKICIRDWGPHQIDEGLLTGT